MAISNAVSLANFTSGDALTVDSVNDRVGIASTVPTTTLDVDGTVTATAFVGDGTNITNAGSTLNASTGDQRLVVTSQTTGSMTEVGTTGDLTYNTTTKTLTAENISIGGTLTYEDVTNVDSVGVVTAGGGIRIGAGGTVGPVGSGIVTYYGDGSKLTGVDATSLKDSNGTIKVQANTFGVVVTGVLTATSFSGDGSGLTFAPRILAFDPQALSTGVTVNKTITITFDQNIQFSGNGTVELRSGSAGGSVIQSFAISSGSPASGLSIAGTQLIINPSSDFATNTVVYVILPSSGISATSGTVYGGSNSYFFQTEILTFSAQGGTEYVLADSGSPTGYYKYHIFASPGILTTSDSGQNAADLDMLIVGGGGGAGSANGGPIYHAGGGGGAGGYVALTQSTIVMSAGSYDVSIGSSGRGGAVSGEQGVNGGETKITPTSSPNNYVYRIFGGGGGGGGLVPGGVERPGSPGASGGGGATPRNTSPGVQVAAGAGLIGQGYAGATGVNTKAFNNPSTEQGRCSGGGGGAGGAAEVSTHPVRYWGGSANNDNYARGGAGGNGATNPIFVASVLTNSGLPSDTINTIGPTGLYAGGGGGNSVQTDRYYGGKGGTGGGGNGWNNEPDSALNYSPTSPSILNGVSPAPYPSPPNAPEVTDAKGIGSGGGAINSYVPGSVTYSGAGTPGILMLRYETPAP